MKKYILIILVALTLVLTGCATMQAPIAMDNSYFETQKTRKIGIATSSIPVAEAHFEGQVGLFDMAIISGAMSSLNGHLKTLDFSEFLTVKEKLSENLKAKGFEVVIIDDFVKPDQLPKFKGGENTSKKDFSSFKEKYAIDDLLFIDINRTGTIRSYYGFVPTSEPFASVSATGQLIDLDNNKFHWYHNSDSRLGIEGEWDEPDLGFPNLTNKVYKAIDKAIFDLTQKFMQ